MNKLALVCTAFLLATVGRAQVLTFEEALAAARFSSWDLKMVEGRYIQAHAQVYKTLSTYLPKVSAGGNYTRNSKESSFKMPNGDEGMKKIILTPLNSLGVQAQVNQVLLSPWLLSQLFNLSKYSQMTKLNKEQARRDVLFGIAQLYYAAASSKEATAAQQHLLDARTAHEANVKLRFEQGFVLKAEVLRAEMETNKNEQDLILAKNTHEAAKLALAAMLSRDADFDVTPPPPPRRPSTEELSPMSFSQNRFDLKASLLQAELAERVKMNNFLKYLPDLSLSLTYKGANTAGLSGQKHSFSLALNLSWNLFDGGFREAEIYENSGKALEARAATSLRDLNVHKQVEIAKLDLSSAEANREKAIKQAELAREQFRLVEASHKEGAATYLEFTDANAALSSAEIALISQNLNVNLAALKLQHELGIFE